MATGSEQAYVCYEVLSAAGHCDRIYLAVRLNQCQPILFMYFFQIQFLAAYPEAKKGHSVLLAAIIGSKGARGHCLSKMMEGMVFGIHGL